jgi:hypothetical protein
MAKDLKLNGLVEGGDELLNAQTEGPVTGNSSEDKVEEKVTTPRKKKFSGKIKNPDMAGRTVFGVTGLPVVFDEDGVATVVEAESDHFTSVPGYQVG